MAYVDVLAKDSVRNLIMPISVEQYHRFSETGLIAEKTELIEGIIFKKITKSPLHEFIAHRLYDFFLQHAGRNHLIRKEAPLALVNSEPEPDISIVKGRLEDFISQHPSYAELVIEVAVSSLELDREKAIPYAGAGIPDYWIVIPEKQQIECYTQPAGDRYRHRHLISAPQSVATSWGTLLLTDLFK